VSNFISILLRRSALLVAASGVFSTTHAATFGGSGFVTAADSTGGLSWNNASGAKAQTVSCWFKLSFPSNFTLSQPMVLMAYGSDMSWSGTEWNQVHPYALYLNPNTGDIDFSTKGTGGNFTKPVIVRPYLERWYHVAVTRSGNSVAGYADGRQVFSESTAADNTARSQALAIGGTTSGYYFRGEIQEAQIFQSVVSQQDIANNRFLDLVPADWTSLKGYFKLGATATVAEQLLNRSAAPPTGTSPATVYSTGPTFEAANLEGEQSLFDSRKNEGKDAIAPVSGGFGWSQTVLSRPTPGIPFDFTIGYNSGNAYNGQSLDGGFDPFLPQPLGVGWRHSFDLRILPNDKFNPNSSRTSVGLLTWEGGVDTWDLDSFGGTGIKFKTRHKEYRGELEFLGNQLDPAATIRWVTPQRLIYTFRSPYQSTGNAALLGRLVSIADLNGNTIQLAYHETGEKSGLVRQITDTAGGVWLLGYDASNLLTSISGPSTDVLQRWTVSFTYASANGRNALATKSLAGPAVYTNAVSPALGTQWQFFYTDSSHTPSPLGVLQRVVDPGGKNDVRVGYDKFGRKSSVMDALSRTTSFAYNNSAVRTLVSTMGSRSITDTFDRKLRKISSRDALGNTSSYTYDDAGNTLTMVDPRSTQVNMTYDARSNVLSSTIVPLNQTTSWVYGHTLTYAPIPGGIALNQATKETNPLGWETRYTFSATGNLLTQADDLGTLATHTYDSRGLPITTKDGNNNETRYTYNAVGHMLTKTIAYGTPKAITTTVVPNELGWTMSETNALQQTVTSLRNINGQPVRITDPLQRVFLKSYDANGNLLSETDGKGTPTTYTYNDADQRLTKTDRGGNTWTTTYDATYGDVASTTSPAATSDGTSRQEITSRSYDTLGRVSADTDTYGRSTTYQYDASSNLLATTDKLGRRWEKTYDVLNRPLTSRDPEGNTTSTSMTPPDGSSPSPPPADFPPAMFTMAGAG
jgi:YD repeat-containing protein